MKITDRVVSLNDQFCQLYNQLPSISNNLMIKFRFHPSIAVRKMGLISWKRTNIFITPVSAMPTKSWRPFLFRRWVIAGVPPVRLPCWESLCPRSLKEELLLQRHLLLSRPTNLANCFSTFPIDGAKILLTTGVFVLQKPLRKLQNTVISHKWMQIEPSFYLLSETLRTVDFQSRFYKILKQFCSLYYK